MRHLKLGDVIDVGNGIFEPIYSFGHHEPTGRATLLEIRTSDETVPVLQISRRHLVFVDKENTGPVAIPAASIEVGDSIVLCGGGNTHEVVRVESIETVLVDDGLFAPFTPSGKLLVNGGLLVSSFIAFDELSPTLRIGGIEFSYQWLAHSFEFPHRVACYHFSQCSTESYNENGLATWAVAPFEFAVWLTSLESGVVKEILLLVLLWILLVFVVVEFAFQHAWLVVATLILFLKMKELSKTTQAFKK
jgi:hypothetical protein